MPQIYIPEEVFPGFIEISKLPTNNKISLMEHWQDRWGKAVHLMKERLPLTNTAEKK